MTLPCHSYGDDNGGSCQCPMVGIEVMGSVTPNIELPRQHGFPGFRLLGRHLRQLTCPKCRRRQRWQCGCSGSRYNFSCTQSALSPREDKSTQGLLSELPQPALSCSTLGKNRFGAKTGPLTMTKICSADFAGRTRIILPVCRSAESAGDRCRPLHMFVMEKSWLLLASSVEHWLWITWRKSCLRYV